MIKKNVSIVKRHLVFLKTLSLLVSACTTGQVIENESDKIDRQALVVRHSVKLNSPDTLASLSVGNGEFAFTVDISGLQSFPEYYEQGVALGTQSQWGWHVIPTDQHYQVEETYRYDTSCTGNVIPHPVQHKAGRKKKATDWLRTNPHRLHLGLIGLELLKENGETASVHDLQHVNQELNMWTGKIESRYEVEGVPVVVELYGHQDADQIAARITSSLIDQERLKVTLKFPYGSGCHVCPGYDWDKPNVHSTVLSHTGNNRVQLERRLDTTIYYTNARWSNGSISEKAKHHFELIPTAGSGTFEFSLRFDREQDASAIADFNATQANSEKNWERFWNGGGVVDFSGSTDPRAHELERRVVLSQYLTKVNCAGSYPPQETGLTFNSWYGKFHIEMHWWHGVHFALWDRLELLQKSLPWYFSSLEKARKVAKMQHFEGARWQKMTDPYGDESPSDIAPYLVWQQPHILYFAELIYRQNPTEETLEKYKALVYETAEFMASFPQFNPETGYYHLCAPVKPAQELWPADETLDPPFELAYWHFGLNVAQNWLERLGQPRNKEWQKVLDNLAPLPVIDGLLYPTAAHPDAYTNFEYMRDHPIVLGTFGMLPHYEQIDTLVMKNTHHKVLERWDWESTWGWDYPMIAMNAARLNMPEKAVDALFMDLQKNTYLPNGHNYQDSRLRIYLPGNGGLLTAVGMMAAGWDGAPEVHAPGFPGDGSWKVRWENLHKMP